MCEKIIENSDGLKIEAFVPKKYVSSARYVKTMQHNLHDSVEQSFKTKDAIIFIGAAGIAVRAIAPFVKSKTTDPAVICMDERGQNVISLLSGHMGRANSMTIKVAEITNGRPIITTATDVNGKIAIDEWATIKNMQILNLKEAKFVAAEILEDNKIGLISDFEITGEIPEEIDTSNKNQYKIGVCISLDENKKPFDITLNLIPKIVSVGVGCKKGTDYQIILGAIKDVLLNNGISCLAIKTINSIDLKKEEEGIIKASEVLDVSFNTFSCDELNSLEGDFSASAFVKNVSGVDSVCERASVMGSNSGKLIIKKTIINSVTVAACIDDYRVDFNYNERMEKSWAILNL